MKFKQLAMYLLFSGVFIFNSCKKEEDVITKESNIPSKFRVDIPASISTNSPSANKVAEGDCNISGQDIYENVTTFVRIGEASSEVVETIILAIRIYDLDDAQSFSFTSDDDQREKDVVIQESVVRNGVTWEYELILKDNDGSEALQVLWNNNPVKGIAIMSPYDLNRTENSNLSETRYQINYNESPTNGYDITMEVQITGLPLDTSDEGAVDNIHLYAGQKGDNVDIWGNSNHPQLSWGTSEDVLPRNYAFVGRGSQTDEIGVAKVAIPPSSVTTTTDLFIDYDIRSVLVEAYGDGANACITEDDPPGYFDNTGFIGYGDTIPANSGFSSEFIDISSLMPYIPKDVADLVVDFQ